MKDRVVSRRRIVTYNIIGCRSVEGLRVSKALTSREAHVYERDGFVVRPDVFSQTEIGVLRGAAERAAAAARLLSESGHAYVLDGKRFVDAGYTTIQFERAPAIDTIRVIEPVHHLDPAFDALIDDARIVEPMQDLVGSRKVALWTDKLNLKRPWEGSGFGWHQDSPYWIHKSPEVDRLPNVMLALDDATEANGCFRIIRGSHARGCLPGTDDGSQLGGFYTSPDHFDESAQVALVLSAGSLVFFSPHVVHGSQPNHSDRPRRALVLTYQPADHPMLKSGLTRNARSTRASSS